MSDPGEKPTHDAASAVDETVAKSDIEDRKTHFNAADAEYAKLVEVDPNWQHANTFLDEVGLGRYQWSLWVLCGFGWTADQMLLQMLAIIQGRARQEFQVSNYQIGGVTSCYFAGLATGALGWGVGADSFGRKAGLLFLDVIAFTLTLLTAGLFGTALGGSLSFSALCGLAAAMGTGTGGNLALDGAIFLEGCPRKNQNLLMLMSVWWCLGQLFASIAAYGLIPPYSCASDAVHCARGDNMGWRYVCITLGGFTLFMWFLRFAFTFYESPKNLIARGLHEEAVVSLNGIARMNRSDKTFSITDFEDIPPPEERPKKTLGQALREHAAAFSLTRLKPLFATRKMGWTTALTWALWISIQIAYTMFNGFLPRFLELKGADTGVTTLRDSYEQYVYISLCGIPGSFAAMYMVDILYLGRKGTMAISSALCALCLILFAFLTSAGGQLAANCIQSFMQNVFYAVLYAYSPEVFPTNVRGTGVGMASLLARLIACWVPAVTGRLVDISVNIPLVISALFFGILAPMSLLLPIETRGKHAM